MWGSYFNVISILGYIICEVNLPTFHGYNQVYTNPLKAMHEFTSLFLIFGNPK